ncbi:hypothetical protein [Micromonospora sp. NPDC005172]|uniref:RICIN domain-containing protein n=1 Tax=Micromonospora sp. NPDC005172 TaxID=3156867 RepID=UPI0033BD7DFC
MKKRAKLRRVWHRLLATRRGRAEMGAFGLSVSSEDKVWKSAFPRPGYVTDAYDGLKTSPAEGAPPRRVAARPDRQWSRRDVSGGTVWIANRNSGMVLEIDGADQVPGKPTAQQDQRRLLGS